MPKGQAFDLEVFKTFNEKTVKKAAEETLAVWTPEAGKRFRLSGFNIYLSAAAVLTLEDEATAFFITVIPITTNVPIVFPQGGYLSTKVANKLNLKLSVEGKLSGAFYGIEDVS